MTSELRPCPFCGGEGEMSFFATPNSPKPAGRFVECIDCSASGPSFEIQGDMPDRDEYTQSKAREAWNARAPDLTERAADPVNAATVLYQHACNMAVGLALAGDFEGYKESAWFKLANAIHDAMPNAIEAGEHHDRG